MERRERDILTAFIESYCNLPCLWDKGSELSKDRNLKTQAWELLAEKLKKLDPAANVLLAKKKIEHMRSARQREAKKIKESKTSGARTSDVHVPNLWYFNLFSPVFEKTDELSRSGKVTSEEESQPTGQTKAMKKKPTDRGMEIKKHKLIDTAQELLQIENKKPNTFGVYVGEQLEEVTMPFQRQVAEKLISEILFLAKTGKLNFDTKIETASIYATSRSHGTYSLSKDNSYSQSPSPQYILPSSSSKCSESSSPSPQYTSPQSVQPSSSRKFSQPSSSRPYIQSSSSRHYTQPSSPHYTQPSSSPDYIQPSPAFHTQTTEAAEGIQLSVPSPQLYSVSTDVNDNQPTDTIIEVPANSVLMELLMVKKAR